MTCLWYNLTIKFFDLVDMCVGRVLFKVIEDNLVLREVVLNQGNCVHGPVPMLTISGRDKDKLAPTTGTELVRTRNRELVNWKPNWRQELSGHFERFLSCGGSIAISETYSGLKCLHKTQNNSQITWTVLSYIAVLLIVKMTQLYALKEVILTHDFSIDSIQLEGWKVHSSALNLPSSLNSFSHLVA